MSRLVSPRDEEEAADDENVDDTNDGRGLHGRGEDGCRVENDANDDWSYRNDVFASSAEKMLL